MNSIAVFQRQEFGSVRTLTENEKTLFCGSDIDKALAFIEGHKN